MKDRSVPERKCIATGQVRAPGEMIRFVVGPDASVVPDLAGKLPGRGIWVTARRECLEKASAKGLFKRAAKAAVQVPDGLANLIEDGLKRRLIQHVSLARKAGKAVAGYEKVKSWLESGEAAVLIQSSDGSERGKSKLRPPNETGAFIGCLTSTEMGLSFGRSHVIHAALASGGLTARAVEDAERLAGLRGQVTDDGAAGPGKD